MFGGCRFTFSDDKVIGESKNWIIEEADAQDVADDNAHAVGNLMVRHKPTFTKREYEAT